MRNVVLALVAFAVSAPVFAACNSECRPNGRCEYSSIFELGCIQYPSACTEEFCWWGGASAGDFKPWTTAEKARQVELANAKDRDALLEMAKEPNRPPIVIRTEAGFSFDSFKELGIERPQKPEGWSCPSGSTAK